MNPSYLYHAFGVRHQECTKTEYKGNQIIHYIQTRKDDLRCPECKSRKIIRSGSIYRDIRSVPVGHRETILRMKVQRIECKSCGCIRQEDIHFVTGKRSYTNKFARYVVGLSRIGTIKDVALFLNISWDTVKDIQKRYLQRHYGNPDLSKLEYIGIDEFAVRKGHVYKTIVADLLTGQVVYVGDGKGADALDGFWKKVRKAKAAIKAVATDLSAAFISSVKENAPDAALVFDHFHVLKLMNDTLDKLRRQAYNQEADIMKRKVLKGTRWLLLRNGEDIYDSCHRNRLENALEMNAPLMKGYWILSQGVIEGNMDAGDEGTGTAGPDKLGEAGAGLKGAFVTEICSNTHGTSQWNPFMVRTSYLYRETGRDKQQNQNNEATSIRI